MRMTVATRVRVRGSKSEIGSVLICSALLGQGREEKKGNQTETKTAEKNSEAFFLILNLKHSYSYSYSYFHSREQ